jgi:hypothetical protein
MPAMPYIQPLPEWITNELKSRASDQARLIKTRPFVILTSPAVVTKTKHSNDTIVSEEYSADYFGCVLSNTTDVSKLYQTGNSIIGYDLNGKPIEVSGEKDRKISVPLIIDLQIEDGGENAVLKTAKLNIKVFSLKQLEMFEMFFLRPGMQLVLEYGNNSDLTSKNTDIETRMFPKTSWEVFVKEFVERYSPIDSKWADNKDKYLTRLRETKGNYDVWTGKVQGYSFSVDTDGTYNVSLEISAGNELASQLLSQTPKEEGKKTAKVVKGNYKSYIAKLAEDIDLKLEETFKDANKWKNEFFNWGIESKTAEDNRISKTPYISVRLILEIINALNLSNNIIAGTYTDENDNRIDVLPVAATKHIMSSNENIIFPGTLPDIIEEDGKIKVGFVPVTDKKTKKTTFEVSRGNESKINGYSFLLDESGRRVFDFKIPTDNSKIQLPPYTGNLLNIFINYDTFVNFKKNAVQNSDLLFSILNLIQMNMYGFCYLELATCDSSPNQNVGLTIIDRKLPKPFTNQQKIDAYRFPIGPTNSIVHTFSFDFQMDDLMAGQTLYSTKLGISDSEDEKFTSQQSDNIRYPITVATSANMEYFKNADGLHSINPIEVKIQKQLHRKKLAEEAKIAKEKKPPTPKEELQKKLDADKEKAAKKLQAQDTLKTNFIRFRLDDKDKQTHNLIYQDPGLLKYYLIKEPDPDSVLVSGVDVTIAIDGMSGFATADYFLIDGVPEIYNQNGVFQITSIQQGINADGWLTTITAGWMRKQI